METEYTTQMSARVTVLEVKVEDIRADNEKILNQLGEISEQLAQYKGFWGALVMITGALGAAVTIGLKYFGK